MSETLSRDEELFLIKSSFNSFAPIAAQITNEKKQEKLVRKFLSVLYDTLAANQHLEQTKNEWVNNVESLYRQERNARFNL